jgi:carbamate kinase
MRIVIALGGNALLRRGETPDRETQRRNVEQAIERAIAPISRERDVIITHGNGPQIGLLALQGRRVSRRPRRAAGSSGCRNRRDDPKSGG